MLRGVLPSKIINDHKANMSDDPGCEKVISKRQCRYPEISKKLAPPLCLIQTQKAYYLHMLCEKAKQLKV